MKIQITHFKRPYGNTEIIEGEIRDDLVSQMEKIKNAGCRITAEAIPPNMVNFCVEEPEVGDYDMILIPNKVGNRAELEKMIERFDLTKFEKWKRILTK